MQSNNRQPINNPKKVGILGGTFDPIHLTHLYMANVAREACALDEIWFIPAKRPPHKEGYNGSDEDRIEMVRLAIQSVSYFKLNLIEFEREGPSFSVDTVRLLQERYPDLQFSFIIGADMVEYLPKWHKIDELVKRIPFIGVGRPGWSVTPNHPYGRFVTKVEMVQSHLSSTVIRALRAEGKSIRFLVPEAVYHYIEENRLYVQEI